jgi:hypothetical protein
MTKLQFCYFLIGIYLGFGIWLLGFSPPKAVLGIAGWSEASCNEASGSPVLRDSKFLANAETAKIFDFAAGSSIPMKSGYRPLPDGLEPIGKFQVSNPKLQTISNSQ